MNGVRTDRKFLFLEGPHGPFLRLLAQALLARGCAVRRVLFNAADTAEWSRRLPSDRYRGEAGDFGPWLTDLMARHAITDIVLYGDARPLHQAAIRLARQHGIQTHLLEEGYVRPRSVTYEREGTNAFSRLCRISLPEMAQAVGQIGPPAATGPTDTWGDSRQHLWLSCLYYIRLIASGPGALPYFRERQIGPLQDTLWYLMRAALFPYRRIWRALIKWRVVRLRQPFHLVLLQLSFDASMRIHSDYPDNATFVEEVVDAFAEGAPEGHLLVFKAHPFENGRSRLGRTIKAVSRDLGVSDRIFFINGGKRLAKLMDVARTVVTVNSTGAQQALWRGLPVVARGRAIYRKHGLTSEQDLATFFRHPRRPDLRGYWIFRAFMVAATQLGGSFYARPGITRLLETLPDAMLAADDSYTRLLDASRRAEEGAVGGAEEGVGEVSVDRAGEGSDEGVDRGRDIVAGSQVARSG